MSEKRVSPVPDSAKALRRALCVQGAARTEFVCRCYFLGSVGLPPPPAGIA